MEQSPSWELTGSLLAKKFPTFYGSSYFITAFTSARHLSLSWARSIQSMSPQPTYWTAILILSSLLSLGLPIGLLPAGFPTKTLYTPLISLIRALEGTTNPKKEFTGMRTYYTSVLNWEAAKFLRNITINEKVLLVYNFIVHFKHYLYYNLKEIKAQWRVTPGSFISGAS